jgi:hypothetical protein
MQLTDGCMAPPVGCQSCERDEAHLMGRIARPPVPYKLANPLRSCGSRKDHTRTNAHLCPVPGQSAPTGTEGFANRK